MIGFRNLSTLEEDRNDQDAALQRSSNLDAHEIIGVLQASIAFLIPRFEPTRTNDREEYVTLSDLFTKHFSKVGAKRDGIDVHKQEIVAELLLQAVVYPTGVTRTIGASVTNEQTLVQSPSPLARRNSAATLSQDTISKKRQFLT